MCYFAIPSQLLNVDLKVKYSYMSADFMWLMCAAFCATDGPSGLASIAGETRKARFRFHCHDCRFCKHCYLQYLQSNEIS